MNNLSKILYVVFASFSSYILIYMGVLAYMDKTISRIDAFEMIESSKISDSLIAIIAILFFFLSVIVPIITRTNSFSSSFMIILIVFLNRNRLMIGNQYAIVGSNIVANSDKKGYTTDSINNKALRTTIIMKESRKNTFLLSC